MPDCSTCGNYVPDGSRYCPACGSRQHADQTRLPSPPAGPDDPTRIAATPDAGVSPPAGRTDATPRQSPDHYTAGTLLAERYRIVGLLGRGGMGEVYRADDLKLGQPVALKFLPHALDADPGRLMAFMNEVRTTREVSHPNVCRVYDVGEADDRHFLTMEYVDGEDLASLLRRIGRLAADKGLEIARQLCAGLAAVHERGLLHRDLKPANVMIDGRGKVRLTDFGVAASIEAVRAGAGLAGTPAYMAPELLTGGEASVRSDIYALGLVPVPDLQRPAPVRREDDRRAAGTARERSRRPAVEQHGPRRSGHRGSRAPLPGSGAPASSCVGDHRVGAAARR